MAGVRAGVALGLLVAALCLATAPGSRALSRSRALLSVLPVVDDVEDDTAALAESTSPALTYCLVRNPCVQVNALVGPTADKPVTGYGIRVGQHTVELRTSAPDDENTGGVATFEVDGKDMRGEVEAGLWWWSSGDAELQFEIAGVDAPIFAISAAKCGIQLSIKLLMQGDSNPQLALTVLRLQRDEAGADATATGPAQVFSAAGTVAAKAATSQVGSESDDSVAASGSFGLDDTVQLAAKSVVAVAEPGNPLLDATSQTWMLPQHQASWLLGSDCPQAAYSLDAEVIGMTSTGAARPLEFHARAISAVRNVFLWVSARLQ